MSTLQDFINAYNSNSNDNVGNNGEMFSQRIISHCARKARGQTMPLLPPSYFLGLGDNEQQDPSVATIERLYTLTHGKSPWATLVEEQYMRELGEVRYVANDGPIEGSEPMQFFPDVKPASKQLDLGPLDTLLPSAVMEAQQELESGHFGHTPGELEWMDCIAPVNDNSGSQEHQPWSLPIIEAEEQKTSGLAVDSKNLEESAATQSTEIYKPPTEHGFQDYPIHAVDIPVKRACSSFTSLTSLTNPQNQFGAKDDTLDFAAVDLARAEGVVATQAEEISMLRGECENRNNRMHSMVDRLGALYDELTNLRKQLDAQKADLAQARARIDALSAHRRALAEARSGPYAEELRARTPRRALHHTLVVRPRRSVK